MHADVVSDAPGTCPKCGMKLIASTASGPIDAHAEHGMHAHDTGDGLEWEDLMPEINPQTNATNMIWKLVDQDTGLANAAIDWSFRVGQRIKIRLVNTMDSVLTLAPVAVVSGMILASAASFVADDIERVRLESVERASAAVPVG